MMLYKAPWMFAIGTQWALLKTDAVAPGTGLFVQARQLTSEATDGQRLWLKYLGQDELGA
jgi:hypothetical protein